MLHSAHRIQRLDPMSTTNTYQVFTHDCDILRVIRKRRNLAVTEQYHFNLRDRAILEPLSLELVLKWLKGPCFGRGLVRELHHILELSRIQERMERNVSHGWVDGREEARSRGVATSELVSDICVWPQFNVLTRSWTVQL